jgi:hypothetical protein
VIGVSMSIKTRGDLHRSRIVRGALQHLPDGPSRTWRCTDSIDPSIAIDYRACIRRVPEQAKSLRDVAS